MTSSATTRRSTGAPEDTGNIKDLRSQVENNPKAAAAWLALAQAYSAENRSQESVNAYERYVALKPQDADALSAMANVMLGEGARLERIATEYYNASVLASQASPGQQPFFGGTSALGQALQNPFTLAQNSEASARSSAWQATATTLQTQANDWYQRALEPYASLTKLRPDDAQSWLYYGDASQQAGETALAITAYEQVPRARPGRHRRPARQGSRQAAQGAAVRLRLVHLRGQRLACPSPSSASAPTVRS